MHIFFRDFYICYIINGIAYFYSIYDVVINCIKCLILCFSLWDYFIKFYFYLFIVIEYCSIYYFEYLCIISLAEVLVLLNSLISSYLPFISTYSFLSPYFYTLSTD